MSQTSTKTTTTWKENLSAFEYKRILSSVRRRLTVEVLCEDESPETLGDLAAAVANREFGDDAAESDVKRVAVTLHHVHLPALADNGALAYDPESHEIHTE